MEPVIVAVFVGQPTTLEDQRGAWRSSIQRTRVSGPLQITLLGPVGNQVAQPYHGSPGAAVCVHMMDHYRHWQARGMSLEPGAVGENLILDGILESEVCAGDVVEVGTAMLQVSGPRTPCANLARYLSRPEWVKQTVQANRTGFYLRVLAPGVLREGDAWLMRERPNPGASISVINRCIYLEFNYETAKRLLLAEGLADFWKDQLREKLAARGEHWTDTIAR